MLCAGALPNPETYRSWTDLGDEERGSLALSHPPTTKPSSWSKTTELGFTMAMKELVSGREAKERKHVGGGGVRAVQPGCSDPGRTELSPGLSPTYALSKQEAQTLRRFHHFGYIECARACTRV